MSNRDAGRRESIITGVLVVVFAAAGVAKVVGLEQPVSLFRQFGFPPWMLIGVGATEILLSLLLLLRSTRGDAAVGLCLVMIAASLAHVMTGVMLPMLFANALLCFSAGWLVMHNRPALLKTSAPRSP